MRSPRHTGKRLPQSLALSTSLRLVGSMSIKTTTRVCRSILALKIISSRSSSSSLFLLNRMISPAIVEDFALLLFLSMITCSTIKPRLLLPSSSRRRRILSWFKVSCILSPAQATRPLPKTTSRDADRGHSQHPL